EDCQRKIPRSDHDRDAARLIEVFVLFAGHVAAARLSQADHFAAIEITVVDALGNVGVGFTPLLAALVDFPGGQLKPAAAHDVGSAEQVLGLFPRRAAARAARP